MMSLLTRAGFAVIFLTAALSAQSPTPPVFDVVSIHVVPPNAPPVVREIGFSPVLPGGQYVDSRTPLEFMIDFAYNVQAANRLLGLPSWTHNVSFSVSAKAGPEFHASSAADNEEQVRLMMRAMLADRFHLQLHSETRQEKVLNLEAVKSGLRIKETDPPDPPAKEGPVLGYGGRGGGGRLMGARSTMEGMARSLTLLTGQPVFDTTGSKAYYDFDVKWTGDEQAPYSQFGSPEFVGPLISNLQSQFGLRLTPATAPIEYRVVDRVEMPTEN
ncbi:MAG TPA: TIGR03435 family protein [Bryobacteraceae bacterium]|jgi:uncharacterized protein (TIGR03435 family)